MEVSYEYFETEGCSCVLLDGESQKPKEVYDTIINYIKELKENGLSKEDYEISKKAVYGDAISSLNSVNSIGNGLMESHFTNREFFSYVDEVHNLQFSDVESKFNEILDCNNSALSVVK